jgi:methionyl-tRNA synthetase
MNNLVTTAISYTNGSPHIGHLYESVLSDFMKHLLIISGKNTKLLTGTDEHGKKIEETAIKNKIKPIDLCNKYSEEFKKLNNNIKTKYDNFIRTTDEDHILLVQEALKKVLDDGNIYLGTYKGWYNTREETFMSELDCKLNNYIDPVSGKPYELIEEETYYFKLSKFKNELIDYVKTLNVNEYVKNELLLKLEDLKDLSISRTSFNWGIKFPFNDKHIVYVWFDALLNYITGKDRLFGEDDTEIIHIIGKDIVWFHAVIYPAILLAIDKQKYITNNRKNGIANISPK